MLPIDTAQQNPQQTTQINAMLIIVPVIALAVVGGAFFGWKVAAKKRI